MKWLTHYERELDLAFAEAERMLGSLPAAFQTPARNYLDRFHALKENRSKNYICYLLPFWLQRLSGLESAELRRFAVANIFGMMYYHLIDECMDEPESGGARKLPLAELIHSQFIQMYGSFFPGASPFWAYYRKYVSEWAEAVSEEGKSDFFHEEPVRMGHKAAPVKLTVAGSMLLAERTGEIAKLEQAVDTVLVTLQLVDDWQDWEKDLREGSYNSLISVTQAKLGIGQDRRPTPEEVHQAISTHDVLLTLWEHADLNHERLLRMKSDVPDLYDFHEYLVDNLKAGAREIQAKRNILQRGGLEFWISNNM